MSGHLVRGNTTAAAGDVLLHHRRRRGEHDEMVRPGRLAKRILGAMRTNRREFLQQAAAVAALTAEQPAAAMPTPRAAAFMKIFGLKYPISNAGMGSAAQPPLTIAVSSAGGLGSLGSGLTATADSIRNRVSRIRTATDR